MESLSDIEEELRDLSRSAEYCELQPTVNGMTISAYFANLADRIAAIDSADAWRSLYTPGNAAAMREALARRKYVKPFKWFKFNRARRCTAK